MGPHRGAGWCCSRELSQPRAAPAKLGPLHATRGHCSGPACRGGAGWREANVSLCGSALAPWSWCVTTHKVQSGARMCYMHITILSPPLFVPPRSQVGRSDLHRQQTDTPGLLCNRRCCSVPIRQEGSGVGPVSESFLCHMCHVCTVTVQLCSWAASRACIHALANVPGMVDRTRS
jgi:hypothetical protein